MVLSFFQLAFQSGQLGYPGTVTFIMLPDQTLSMATVVRTQSDSAEPVPSAPISRGQPPPFPNSLVNGASVVWT